MTPVEPVRLAIIGAGFGAQVHLPAFLSIPNVRVIGIADSGSGRAQQVAEMIGKGVRAWGSWQEAVEASDVDALSIVTPSWIHTEVVHAALATGKHVLCEKPFGLNGKEAVRMCEQARTTGRANAVDFEFRMEPGIAALKRLIECGEIGAVRRIDVRWLTRGGRDPSVRWSWRHDRYLGGGVLNGFVSHVVDYVEWISGSRISRVSARCEILIKERMDAQGGMRPVTAEDRSELLCDLESGAVAELTVSNCSPSEFGHRVEIQGDTGRLLYLHEAPFTLNRMSLRVETDSMGKRNLALEPLPGPVQIDSRIPPFRQLAMRFVDAASGLTVRDLPDFACGMRVQQVLDAARESSRQGCAVPVARDQPGHVGSSTVGHWIRS